MIRAVLVEHIANQRHKTLGNPRLIRTLGGRQRFKPVLSEALVVQHANDIVVTRDGPPPSVCRGASPVETGSSARNRA